MTGTLMRTGAVTRSLSLLLALIAVRPSHLAAQQAPSRPISECKQLYDERRYVEARNCFSRILTQDPKDPTAREYYRLSNVLAVGISKSEDSSHSPGTPEIPGLQKLVQEALESDSEVHRILQVIEGIQSNEQAGSSIDSSLEFLRLGVPYFYPCQWHPLPTGDIPIDPELQKQLAAPVHQWWQSLLQCRKNELLAQVKKSYVRLFSVRQELLIHDEHRRNLNENKRIVLARYRQNQVSQNWLLEAQREEIQGIEDLIQLEKKEASARASLNSLLSRDPALLIRLPESVEVPEFSWDLRQMENLALANRPELRAAGACTQQASLWMKTTGSADSRSHFLNAEELGARAVEIGIKREVHEAFIDADNGYRLLKFCETTLIPQLETARLSAKASYRSGEADYERLIQSQRELTAGKVRKVTAQADYLVGLAELERAVGVPLERRGLDDSSKRNSSAPEE
jgi:Outer membrane efflux protein